MIAADSPDAFGFPVIDLPVAAQSSLEAAVRFLVEQLVQSGRLEAESAAGVCCQVLHRESLGTTRIGRGVAIPHSKSDLVSEVLGIVGQAVAPMPWPGAPNAERVRLVCLLVTPASEPATALRALEAVSRRMRGC